MKRFLVVCLAALLAPTVAHADNLYRVGFGPHRVLEALAVWRDEARDRVVPIKIYAPVDGNSLLPVVVVSHGAGGARDGLAFLGRHWASHGYAVVHLQHAGSDAEVWRGLAPPAAMQAIRRAVENPQSAIARPQDVRFAINRMLSHPLDVAGMRVTVDPERIAVAGHSFGAFTALSVAGATFFPPGRGPANFGDDRVVASIALSPPGFRAQHAETFARVRIPTLHMTGSADYSVVVNDLEPADRRRAYDLIAGASKYLVILDGGDHMVFGGARRTPKPTDARHHALIRAITTAFLDSIVKGDRAAALWLRDVLPGLTDGIALQAHETSARD